MPILTKAQILEAVSELPEADRFEVIDTLSETERPLHLTEEQKDIIRAEVEAHRLDPSTAVSREGLMAKLPVKTYS